MHVRRELADGGVDPHGDENVELEVGPLVDSASCQWMGFVAVGMFDAGDALSRGSGQQDILPLASSNLNHHAATVFLPLTFAYGQRLNTESVSIYPSPHLACSDIHSQIAGKTQEDGFRREGRSAQRSPA